jgi:ABC-type lipoprotein export system ATPase subunit
VSDNIFRVENLCKFYPSTQSYALRDLTLTVQRGEFLAVRGPSGSGKSTLLYILGGLLKSTSGRVYFNELLLENEKSKSLYRRNNIGFVFQDFYLYPGFTVLENILFPCAHKLFVSAKIVLRARELLNYLQISHKEKNEVLSAGERQRVCIARALLLQPPVILADEPTGNLDSKNAKNTLSLFQKINQEFKTTMVLVTHDDAVNAYAHRSVHIVDGRVEGC